MSFILKPWQVLFMVLASWVHREQQKTIEFYQAELEAMMKAQGKKRVLLTDDQRRLLAVKGKALGRKALMELTTIVTLMVCADPQNQARFSFLSTARRCLNGHVRPRFSVPEATKARFLPDLKVGSVF